MYSISSSLVPTTPLYISSTLFEKVLIPITRSSKLQQLTINPPNQLNNMMAKCSKSLIAFAILFHTLWLCFLLFPQPLLCQQESTDFVRQPAGQLILTPHQRSHSDPQQVHISLVGNDKMRVSWVTEDKGAKTVVEYGTEAGEYSAKATGKHTSYQYFFYGSGKIHDAVIGPLKPSTTYFYRCGGSAPEFSFKTTPSKLPIEFAIAEPFMEAEEVLKLFDSFWFGLQNLEEHPSPSTSTSFDFDENPDHQIKEGPSEEPKLSRMQTSHHTRSMSDQLNSMASFKHDSSLSPDSVLFSPKLQTILSGKDVTDIEAEKQDAQVVQQKLQVLSPEKKNIIRRGRGKRESKSLSDLEFEELKGFMDLGFVFSEEDKDSSLASIIPGLQRLGKNNGEEEEEEEEEEDFDESAVQRPYLSEAWKVQEERRKKENPLMNWKIPAVTNENDMKYSLRCWAHTVASTVR